MGRLGEYVVTEVVAQGGMGVVLKGFDPGLQREVAIKVLAQYLAGDAVARQAGNEGVKGHESRRVPSSECPVPIA